MTLRSLQVANVRNLEQVEVRLESPVSLITGPNGSGKTSVLESVHLLAVGRSFRAGRSGSLIRYGSASCTVFGSVQQDEFTHGIGFTRGRDGTREFRINGERQSRVSEVTRILPVQVLGPRTIDLIQEGPEYRRRFIGWGVFHVKPSYQPTWTAAERSLRHRNRLLRSVGKKARPLTPPALEAELASWEKQLAEHAANLHLLRSEYLGVFRPVLDDLLLAIGFAVPVVLDYHPGWSVQDAAGDQTLIAEDLAAVLEDCRAVDVERGFTTMGHHRADLRIRTDGHPAADYLSRGQLKLLAWAMTLAQGLLLRDTTARSTVFLVDDLAAELDGVNAEAVSSILVGSGSQCIATGLDDTLMDIWPSNIEAERFAINSGRVRPLD